MHKNSYFTASLNYYYSQIEIKLKTKKIDNTEEVSRESKISYLGKELLLHSAGIGNPDDGGIELLLKNCNDINGKTLLVECGQGVIEQAITEKCEVTSFHTSYIDYSYSIKNGFANSIFSDIVTSSISERFDFAIFRITKSSIYNQLAIGKILSVLNSSGKLWIFGATKEGIKGVSSKLKKAGVTQSVVANGNRNRILEIGGDNHFDVKYESEDTIYSIGSKELIVKTTPGLFSHGKVDRGTELLLNNFPKCGKKRVLDLGCGSGILSKFALSSGATEVVAVDVSVIAVDATRENLEGLGESSVIGGYMTNDLVGKFDIIITNPPFHEGGSTNYSIGEEWLDSISSKLSRKGEIWLVANIFLPYKSMSEKRFGEVETVIEKDGFRVFRIRKWK
jgi:16S rRNA (guanine1207-N2)-methyltransferase